MTIIEVKKIWNNKSVPVVHRPENSKIRVRLPYAKDNRKFLGGGTRKREPEWHEKKYWELPKSRFNETVNVILERHGKVYIIQPYVETEQCAPACMNARGHECQCSCLGANHGQSNDGRWFEVSESLALRHGERVLGCRLLKVTDSSSTG